MNFLEPLTFVTIAEAQKYANSHACALCLSNLIVHFDRTTIWLECPEHGKAFPHNVATRGKAKKVDQGVKFAALELAAEEPHEKSADEILAELGF